MTDRLSAGATVRAPDLQSRSHLKRSVRRGSRFCCLSHPVTPALQGAQLEVMKAKRQGFQYRFVDGPLQGTTGWVVWPTGGHLHILDLDSFEFEVPSTHVFLFADLDGVDIPALRKGLDERYRRIKLKFVPPPGHDWDPKDFE